MTTARASGCREWTARDMDDPWQGIGVVLAMTYTQGKQTVNATDFYSNTNVYFFAAKYFFHAGVELFVEKRQHCE
jgi:hypothetical protein